MQRFILSFTLFILSFALSIPASYAGKADDTLNIPFNHEVKALDNYFTTDRVTIIMGRLLFDSLIYRDPETYQYKPLLATSYKSIDDRTMEFVLRHVVKYHNGEEFDADDVVFTFNFFSDPANKVKTHRNVNWIERVEKLGKYKVRLITKKPFPAAIEYLAGPLPIYTNEHYDNVGPDAFGANPIGTGHYHATEVEESTLPKANKSEISKFKKNLALNIPEEIVNAVTHIVFLDHGIISMEISGRFHHIVNDFSRIYAYQISNKLKRIGYIRMPPSPFNPLFVMFQGILQIGNMSS